VGHSTVGADPCVCPLVRVIGRVNIPQLSKVRGWVLTVWVLALTDVPQQAIIPIHIFWGQSGDRILMGNAAKQQNYGNCSIICGFCKPQLTIGKRLREKELQRV